MAWSKELVAASATPLILSILSQGENYGYGIIKRVTELTDGEVQWTDGMLYPVLHRLEKQKYIESQWNSGRKRKYYRICKEGKAELETQKGKWSSITRAIFSIGDEELCLN